MDIIQEVVKLISETGMAGVAVFAFWLIYKTSMVSIICFALYKSICKIVDYYTGNVFIEQCASELGFKTPLSAQEEKHILDILRRANEK